MGNEVDQDLVKEIDMVGPQVSGILEKQVREPRASRAAPPEPPLSAPRP
jgi:hypothetical protein